MNTFRQTRVSTLVPGGRIEEGTSVAVSRSAPGVSLLTLVLTCTMPVIPLHAQTFEWARSAGGTLAFWRAGV